MSIIDEGLRQQVEEAFEGEGFAGEYVVASMVRHRDLIVAFLGIDEGHYNILREKVLGLVEYANDQRAKVNYLLAYLHELGHLPEGHFTFPNGDTDYAPSLPGK